jgi:sugar phosphate permease
MATIAALDKEIEAIQPSPPLSSEASSQLDDTYEAYKNNKGLEVDAEEAKKVLRKIDFRIVPILFFVYLLQYLDKNGINYASAFGLEEGTNLSGQDYSWLGELTCIDCGTELITTGSIFYFGYLLGQYPSGYLLQRLPIAKFLGCATLGQLLEHPADRTD